MTRELAAETLQETRFGPLKQLVPPGALDGREGHNRAHWAVCQLEARTDIEAVRAWLSEYSDSPNTQRAYRKEAERLLLWGLIEQGKALSSLTREDILAYEAFLANPKPRDRWCGPRRDRTDPRWRPLQGPLKASSRHQALVILNALFTYLVEAGYLAGNPLALKRRQKRRGRPKGWRGPDRHLDQEAWRFALAFLEALPQESDRQRAHKERLRFLLSTLYLLGPRVSELATHNMGSFYRYRGRWWWRVMGKGEKAERVPVNDDMLAALQRYRTYLELPPLPKPDDTTPLVLNLKGNFGISANMIYRIIKQFFHDAAQEAHRQGHDFASVLEQVSTHWLRHTSFTHQADAGIELRYLQRNARHERLDTTSLYVHADERPWHEAMSHHRLNQDADASERES